MGKFELRGDLDGDYDVDQDDLNILLAAKDTVSTGVGDPRDLDNDGLISDLDAQILATLCSRPECATGMPANTPPTANADPDQTVPAGARCLAPVTLDGMGSSDPDGDTLTFTWTGPFGTASGLTPTVSLPLGTHPIMLNVDDGKGGTASDTMACDRAGYNGPSPCPRRTPDHNRRVRSGDHLSADRDGRLHWHTHWHDRRSARLLGPGDLHCHVVLYGRTRQYCNADPNCDRKRHDFACTRPCVAAECCRRVLSSDYLTTNRDG